jgi:hypothetical protein
LPSRALAAVFVFDSPFPLPVIPDGGDVADDEEEGIF